MCGVPGSFSLQCGECQASPRPWNACIVATDYANTNRELIRAAKFHNKDYYLRIYCELLAEQILKYYGTDFPSQWATVPSHASRIKERGKCSNDILYRFLKRSFLETTGYKTEIQRIRLKKHIHTEPQHKKSRSKRLSISSSLFHAPNTVTGHVALIDDIFTTGATLEACTKSLLSAGAESVDVWVLARTPPF